ncbi:hypothetical protein AAID24_004741 [Escherichia coli]
MDFTDLSIYKDLDKYQSLVNEAESKYENDIEKIKYAKEKMPDNFYIQYVISILQKKLIEKPMNDEIVIRAGILEDFLRSVLYINDYVSDDIPYDYVVKKSDRFINTLIRNLYK